LRRIGLTVGDQATGYREKSAQRMEYGIYLVVGVVARCRRTVPSFGLMITSFIIAKLYGLSAETSLAALVVTGAEVIVVGPPNDGA
jgi:hypothetical protein